MPTLNVDPGQLGLGALATIGSIILIDIALSSDNALVIGAAASRLPRAQRILALLWGGIGAIVLRVVLAGVATELLLVPLLQSVGGLVIMIIAVRMLIPDDEMHVNASNRFFPAILTILVADVTMSLDNIIAVGALAKGDVLLLGIGLLVSMAVLFLASAIVARIIERLEILLDLAAVVLALTAANLVIGDPRVGPYVGNLGFAGLPGPLVLQAGLVAFIIVLDVVLRLWRGWRSRRARRTGVESAPSEVSATASAPGNDAANTDQAAHLTPDLPDSRGEDSVNGFVVLDGTAQAGGEASNGHAPLREPVTSQPIGGQSERTPED